jgi:ammonia channel protein AmtB
LQSEVAGFAVFSGAIGGLSAFLYENATTGKASLFSFSRGLIAGVVAVSGDVDQTNWYLAILFGLFGGVTYKAVSQQIQKSGIDDPIDAIGVHFVILISIHIFRLLV